MFGRKKKKQQKQRRQTLYAAATGAVERAGTGWLWPDAEQAENEKKDSDPAPVDYRARRLAAGALVGGTLLFFLALCQLVTFEQLMTI